MHVTFSFFQNQSQLIYEFSLLNLMLDKKERKCRIHNTHHHSKLWSVVITKVMEQL